MAAWAERRPRPSWKECHDRLAMSALRFVIGGEGMYAILLFIFYYICYLLLIM